MAELRGVKPFTIHPTVLNLTSTTPPSITNIAQGAVDIVVLCTQPSSEKEWDLLEEAVGALDQSFENGKIVICMSTFGINTQRS